MMLCNPGNSVYFRNCAGIYAEKNKCKQPIYTKKTLKSVNYRSWERNYMEGITNASQLMVKEEEEEEKVMNIDNKECKVKKCS
jgi:hypothetical protein